MHKYVLIAIAFIVMAVAGCGSVAPTPEELNNTSIALHVKVLSTPPGAVVYGVDGDGLGDSLGTTPFVARYIQRRVADRPEIFGTAVDQTINSNLDFKALNIDDANPFVFQCWLVKDGFKKQLVVKSLSRNSNFNPRDFSTSDAFQPGEISVMVDLEPSDISEAQD